MNLAESLLGASERHPELEAFPGIPYGELLPRVRTDRRRPGRRSRRPRRARPRQPARDRAPLLGVPVGGGGRGAALVAALRGRARLLHRGLRRRRSSSARTTRCPTAPSTRASSIATSGRPRCSSTPPGRRAGRRASRARTRADRAGAWSQALQHGYAWRDRTLGVMPLYHTMGIHSLLAMHLVGGCFVPQPRWDAGEALRLDRGAADQLPVPRADALPRPRPPPGRGHGGPLLGARARLRRRRDDVDASSGAASTSSGRRCSSTTTARPRSTPSRSDATSSRSRGAPAARPSTRGSGSTRTARSSCISGRTRRSRATGIGPTPTRRRCGTAGTAPATRAPRRGRRPLARRAGRRHDRLGRREHPSARGRGGAGSASRRRRGRGRSERRTSASASASSPSWSGRRAGEELDAHCLGSSLARFKRPREYRQRDALPKSASGKILRRLLRDEESA